MPSPPAAVSLNALRAFAAVARDLSVSQAARDLGVTHGAVSRQISGLENELGVALFDRHRNRLALSDAGRALFADVAPAIERLQTAVHQVRGHASPATLLINVPPTFAMRWLIPRLSSFQRRRPEVEIRLTTGKSPLGDLPPSGVDIIIRRLQQRSPKHAAVPFLSASLVPVCAPELLEQQPIRSPSDLQGHVLLHSKADEWSDWFAKAGVTGLRPRSELVFEEIYFAMQAALDGLGVALVPSPLVTDDVAAGRLCMPLDLQDVDTRDYHYLASPFSRRKDLVHAFCQWLSTEGKDSNRLADELITTLFPASATG
ncbi:Gcv operon activator [Variovorax sp. SRS16]|uniref:LysR substrate-binding domain-containing protein n=1 Tax=Variovorax sp. SRS16 TaxID=282217 RepID=UPI0013196814|nr:LysR substrate-binding domain-containing protein [Variovorax sp. SRS16]VTU34348.1 Gcv operon activator [Variovorax sp. SRS16]